MVLYRGIESSSLVPVLFREVFSHPYISFFHLLVNCFFVIYIYIYIFVYKKNIVIERTRDLIYLKFVATDFFLKIISPSAGESIHVQGCLFKSWDPIQDI